MVDHRKSLQGGYDGYERSTGTSADYITGCFDVLQLRSGDVCEQVQQSSSSVFKSKRSRFKDLQCVCHQGAPCYSSSSCPCSLRQVMCKQHDDFK